MTFNDRDRLCRKHGREKCTSRKCRKRLLGDCWVCGGTGRVTKHGCTKTVACAECDGSGGSRLPQLLRQLEEEDAA